MKHSIPIKDLTPIKITVEGGLRPDKIIQLTISPHANIEGAVLARKELSKDITIVLIGDQEQILSGLSLLNEDSADYEIVHAPDVITMHDHPTRAIPQKPNSSIAVGFDLLAAKKIDAFASTGNTGAMLVGAMFKINQ